MCIFTNFFYITKFNLPISSVHFWAPTFKWGISIANVADFTKPPEKLSYPQQIGMWFLIQNFSVSFSIPSRMSSCWSSFILQMNAQTRFFNFVWWYSAVTFTGLIWSRYSTVITPVSPFCILVIVDVFYWFFWLS